MAKLDIMNSENFSITEKSIQIGAHAPSMNLANHFLIAMPSILDPVFSGTVVYLCQHNANGALGLVINKSTDMSMEVLFDRIDLNLKFIPVQSESEPNSLVTGKNVMFGGPIQVERGFVLHRPDKNYLSTLKVTDHVAITTSKDVMEEVAHGSGPQQIMFSLGCAGWSAGQLENEIIHNDWLTVTADPEIIFDAPISERFTAAVNLLGISPYMLTTEFGRA
jgi:putative transcriptional regulator